MKKYRKIWLTSFTVTILSVSCAIFAFLLVFGSGENVAPAPRDDGESLPPKGLPEDYVNYSDNVGGVSFTEDQITELVRNVYSLDGFITGLDVDFEKDGTLTVNGKIKNMEKLYESCPELSDYDAVLKTICNKEITVKGKITDSNGMADYRLISGSVGKMPVDVNLLSPFLQEGVFTQLFDVKYDSIEISENSVVFKDGLPSVLQY